MVDMNDLILGTAVFAVVMSLVDNAKIKEAE